MINQTTIYGSTVTYFLSLIRANLTDVSTPTGKGVFQDARNSTSTWVVSSFPQPKKYGNFPGYPIVIVNSPEIEQESFSFGNTKLDTARLSITVLDKNSSQVNSDNIMAQIKQAIQNHWESTRAQGISLVNLVSDSNSVTDSGDDTIIKRLEYQISYRNLPSYKTDV